MSTSANSYVLQRRRADTLTRLRAETLGRLPHTETMAAVLAELGFDLNDCDSVVFGLLEHGFSAREINDTVDAALARAFAIRRDRASNSHRPTMTWIDSAPPFSTDCGGALNHSSFQGDRSWDAR